MNINLCGFPFFAISALLGVFGIEIGIVGALLIGAISIVSLKINPMTRA